MENLIQQFKDEPDAELEIRFKLDFDNFANFINKIKDHSFELNQSISLIKIIKTGGSESEHPYNGELPLKRYNYSDEQIHEMFRKLRDYNYLERKVKNVKYRLNNINDVDCTFEGEYLTFKSLDTDYEDFNQLSDMFQETNRLKCKVFTEKLSPYDYFIMNKHEVESYARKNFNNVLSNYTVRESLYKLVRECTTFRPNLMVIFIKMFNAKSVLDFSSGWGDRLIGCMSQDVEYCGIDPNHNLHPKYQEMIKFFNKDPAKYIMINDSIQDATIPDKTFDLVFTSPPYFDLEEYQGEKQSIKMGGSKSREHDSNAHASRENNAVAGVSRDDGFGVVSSRDGNAGGKNHSKNGTEISRNDTEIARNGTEIAGNVSEEYWIDNFLSVALNKCWNVLRIDGYMCININQKNNKETYVSKMIDLMKSLKNSEYLGVISYTNERHTHNHQPIFIVKKEGARGDKVTIEEKEIKTDTFLSKNKKFIKKYVKPIQIPPFITFDDIPYRLPYIRGESNYINKAHFGQRKLFLSELQYLTNYADKTNEFVVYAGAATAMSRYELGKLFPKIKFIMVDPNSFALHYAENNGEYKAFFNYRKESYIHSQICFIKRSHKMGIYQQTEDFEKFAGDKHYLETNLVKFITTTNYQFYLIEDYYTTELSQKLEPLNKIGNVHFWSDIRTTPVGKGPTDLDILWNSAQHFNWTYYLKPKRAMYKFRLPFRNDVEYVVAKYDEPMFLKDFNMCKELFGVDLIQEYIDNKPFRFYNGIIYLQTRERVNSTETRLVVENFNDIVEYDLALYEDKHNYYNNIARPLQLFINPASNRRIAFDHCADCAIEYDIFAKYLKSKHNNIKYYDLNREVLNRVFLLNKITGRYLSEGGHGNNFPLPF